MPLQVDITVGQLAIARGLTTIANVIRCAQIAGKEGTTLEEAFLTLSILTHEQINALRDDIQRNDPDTIRDELEQGNTIVLESIAESIDSARDVAVQQTLAASPEDTLLAADLTLDGEYRYEFREELGRGGMGKVLLARDRILNRNVAFKTLHQKVREDTVNRERLITEARVTGVLEHPSIVPVYDLRSMSDAEPFYTMRVVQERNLDEILQDICMGNTSFSLVQLCQVLRQVSLAIQYAHDLGVVHRDLKPENILVGKYGEVYVIDWGIAKIVREIHGMSTTSSGPLGALVGTPQYMAPEQARGENDAVDERTDVYALGTILYEMLTLTPTFSADHVLSLLFLVVNEDPEPPTSRAPHRNIPTELEEICMKALAKEPADRYQSAQRFADELELFLEGVKERDRRERMARESFEQARFSQAVYEEVRDQYLETFRQLSVEKTKIPTWAPSSEKEDLWELEQQAENLRVEIERRFGEVVRMYGQALVHLPEMTEARFALAQMYQQRFEEAENQGNRANAAYFEGLVRQYNDGAFDSYLEGSSQLRMETDPSGVDVTLFRYEEQKRRFVAWEVARLGATPLKLVDVSHGSHLLFFERQGMVPLRVPVVLGRATETVVAPRMYPMDAIPDDFVVISAGEFIHGTRHEHAPDERAYLADFAISRHPITCGEYLVFLNDIASRDPAQAAQHTPRVSDDAESYFPMVDGVYRLPEQDKEGDQWDLKWPIIMISYRDAEAYARWRSAGDGRNYRLPTALEWEKAARGVDGRLYPWGNHFDPSYCRMRDSVDGKPTPCPVGLYKVDQSPYGVMDMAGNVAEWTSTSEPSRPDMKIMKGASFNSMSLMCRLDQHMNGLPAFRFVHHGFRLVLAMETP